MSELLYRDETSAVQGAIFEVSREIGVGFLEDVYQDCLALEFADRNIPFIQKPELKLQYKGRVLERTYVPDFICCGKIVVELKAVRELTEIHRAQIINYLRSSGLRVGLLVNFGSHPKALVERFVV